MKLGFAAEHAMQVRRSKGRGVIRLLVVATHAILLEDCGAALGLRVHDRLGGVGKPWQMGKTDYASNNQGK